jgi:dihydropyrimidinase
VLPGVIDPHVHVRQEGHSLNEPMLDDLEAASRVALLGGVTTMFAYVQRTPANTALEMVERQIALGQRAAYVDFGLNVLCLPGDDLETLVDVGARKLGVHTFKAMLSYNRRGLMLEDDAFFRVLAAAAAVDAVVLVHAENGRVIDHLEAQARTRGSVGREAHLACAPGELEAEGMFKAAMYSHLTGCRVLFVHLSSRIARDTLAWLKSGPYGTRLAVETQPHYALLTNEAVLIRGPLGKVGPPLREAADRDAIVQAVASGLVSHLSSDHAPRSTAVKLAKDNILDAPYGGTSGTEVLLALAHKLGPEDGHFGIEALARLTATNTARAYGAYPRKGTIRPGSDGDLVVVPVDGPARPLTPKSLHGPSDYSLYEGLTSRGFPRYVIRGGVLAVVDGEVKARVPGRYLGQA